MIPDGFSSSSTGATIPVVSALHHTGKRFLLRPDIRSKLQDGDEIVHLAKIGSDYATGHGRMNQKRLKIMMKTAPIIQHIKLYSYPPEALSFSRMKILEEMNY